MTRPKQTQRRRKERNLHQFSEEAAHVENRYEAGGASNGNIWVSFSRSEVPPGE
ncbi:MAG: hypothetical protein U5K69_24620 [Balneolaceae bacterium]|nr:hypothetical protein [Balneolaceae bacterium]